MDNKKIASKLVGGIFVITLGLGFMKVGTKDLIVGMEGLVTNLAAKLKENN